MSHRETARLVPMSLVWATDLDVLPLDRVVERRDVYLAVRSPNNPGHYWGNLLLFDEPPDAGDGSRWERLFEVELGSDPRVRHALGLYESLGFQPTERVSGVYRRPAQTSPT